MLVRVRRVGICGTDLHAFTGTQPFFTYPRILGHELAVEVVDIHALEREAGTVERRLSDLVNAAYGLTSEEIDRCGRPRRRVCRFSPQPPD